MKGLLTVVVAVLVAGVALGQFTATNPGPINSAAPYGDPNNGSFTFTYAGPNFTPNALNFSGDLTSTGAGSWPSEARWRVTNPAAQFANFQPTTQTGTWVGTLPISATFPGLSATYTGTSVGTWTFEAWESFDDGGPTTVDAIWTNLSFGFTAAAGWSYTNYFSEAAFLAAIQPNFYLEDYSSYTYGSPLNGTQTSQAYGPTNGYAYTVTNANGLWSNLSALSTNSAHTANVVTFDPNYNPVTAIGGNFTATDINGNIIPGTVTITDANGATWTLTGQTGSSFFGFTSTVPIVSAAFNCPNLNDGVNRWVQMDHFYVGQIIPEPASLLLIGLAGLMLRRR